MLLLDSFDEVPSDEENPFESWRLFDANPELLQWPHLKVVVSCRDYYFSNVHMDIHRNFHTFTTTTPAAGYIAVGNKRRSSKVGGADVHCVCCDSSCQKSSVKLNPFDLGERGKYVHKRAVQFVLNRHAGQIALGGVATAAAAIIEREEKANKESDNSSIDNNKHQQTPFDGKKANNY